jgi:hypothetical protein
VRNILSGNGHGRTEFVCLGEDVGVKERFANDAHGQVGHLLVDVNAATIKPGLLDMLAVMAHDAGIAGNVAWLEGWGHELALLTVEIAFATEDAVTNHRAKGIMDGQPFIEVIGMFNQNAMDMLWFVEQDDGERPKMHAIDVAFARHTLKEAQSVSGEVGQAPDKRVPANIAKRFGGVYVCLNVCCHGMLLINPADA